jgi:putative tryptophan/tyrosine transport system substrate-binding protein
MDRRIFIAWAAGNLVGVAFAARAQALRTVPTIGFLGPPPSAGGLVQAFQRGLLDFGYVEGRNIKVEYRYTDVALQGNPQLMAQLANELVSLKPDVLVVSVTEAALAARNATRTIPIVMVSVADPVAAGLVASLARPGGNVTGLCRQTPELIGKNLQLLKEAFPGTTDVGVLVNPSEPLKSVQIGDVNEAAKSLGVRVIVVEARPPSDLDSAFATMRSNRVGVVLVLGGAAFYLSRVQIADLALRERLPSMFQNREFVEAGGLLSYAPSTVDNYRRAASFVHRILQGARPADLPVELPQKYELVVNLKTAKVLGVTVPESLRLRADEVIQ